VKTTPNNKAHKNELKYFFMKNLRSLQKRRRKQFLYASADRVLFSICTFVFSAL